MTAMNENPEGTFAWVDLGTSDLEKAKAFYGALFGWTMEVEGQQCEECPYAMIRLDGKLVGGAYTLCEEQHKMNVPPHWMSYLAVRDAAATTARAEAQGGKVLVGVTDIFDMGKMALLQDPQGAVFALWQGAALPGVEVRDEDNTFCWQELNVKDPEAVLPFYQAVAGWAVQKHDMPTGAYHVFQAGETVVAGAMAIDPAWGDVPPHWAVYFMVADIQDAVEKAKSLGATVHLAPLAVEGVGSIACLADPQGAVFSLIQVPSGCGCESCGSCGM